MLKEQVSMKKAEKITTVRLCTQYVVEEGEGDEGWTVQDNEMRIQDIPVEALHKIVAPFSGNKGEFQQYETKEMKKRKPKGKVNTEFVSEWVALLETQHIGEDPDKIPKWEMSGKKCVNENRSGDKSTEEYWAMGPFKAGRCWVSGLRTVAYHVPDKGQDDSSFVKIETEYWAPNHLGIVPGEGQRAEGLEFMEDVMEALPKMDGEEEEEEEITSSSLCPVCRAQVSIQEHTQQNARSWA